MSRASSAPRNPDSALHHPSHRDYSPPLGTRGGLSGEYHALHQDPEISRLPRHKKPRHKSVADHTTRHNRNDTQPEHQDHKLTGREPPVQASSNSRTWCSPPSVRKTVCPSTSPKRVAGTVTRGINNKYKLTTLLPQKHPTPKPYIPPELGKSSERLAVRANTVGFFQSCVEARGPNNLNQLPPSPQSAATLFEHMQIHGVPINMERGMITQEITRAIK